VTTKHPRLSLEELRGYVAGSPFATWLGLRVEAVTLEAVVLTIVPRPEMGGRAGTLHGGVIASLVDAACSYAIVAAAGPGLATVDLRTDYHRGVKEAALTVTAQIVHLGGTLATAEARIADPDGKLVASGRAVFKLLRR
jgi:uncharacterized protein (TIGR00369 family)